MLNCLEPKSESRRNKKKEEDVELKLNLCNLKKNESRCYWVVKLAKRTWACGLLK